MIKFEGDVVSDYRRRPLFRRRVVKAFRHGDNFDSVDEGVRIRRWGEGDIQYRGFSGDMDTELFGDGVLV